MSSRHFSAAALAVSCALACSPFSVPLLGTQTVQAQDDITREMMLKMVEDLWSAPSEKVKQQAAALVNKATQRKANMTEVRYAQGLLMLHKDEVDAATSIFKRMTKEAPTHPLGWLALAHAQIIDDKADAAIASLTKAIQLDPKYLPTIQSVASLVTFYTEKPPAKIKVGKLSELESSIYPKLSPELQTKYKAAQLKTKEYLANIETLRKEKMAVVGEAKKEMLDLQKEIRKAEAEKNKIESALQAMDETLRQLAQQRALRMGNFDNNIAAARAKSDQNAINQLAANKANLYSQYESEYIGIQSTYNRKQSEYTRVKADLDNSNKQYKKAEKTVNETQRRVEKELNQPPMPLMPDRERERIRKGDPLDPYQASKEPPPSASGATSTKQPPAKEAGNGDGKMTEGDKGDGEQKADSKEKGAVKKTPARGKQLFSQAEMLQKAGRLDAAVERYKKIAKEYAGTEWGDAAQDKLKEIEESKVKDKK